MAKFKPPKRLFKTQDVVHSYRHDRENRVDFKHMTRDHADVLQNIEFVLVMTAKNDSNVDDRAVHDALQMAIKKQPPDESTDARIVSLLDGLDSIRETREDVSDTIWVGGLRTIAESIQNHSKLAPGEKGYLGFASKYVR